MRGNTNAIPPCYQYIDGYIKNGLIYDFSMQKFPTYDEVSGEILRPFNLMTSVNTENEPICCENGNNKGGMYIPNLPLLNGLTSFSISIWFNLDSVSGTAYVFASGQVGSLKMVSLLLENGSVNYNAYSDDVKGNVPLQSGTWYHACIVQDESTAYIYLNGTLMNSKVMNVNFASNNNQLSTNMGLITDYLSKGKTVNLLIYNRALSAAEVLQNYNATRSYFE